MVIALFPLSSMHAYIYPTKKKGRMLEWKDNHIISLEEYDAEFRAIRILHCFE